MTDGDRNDTNRGRDPPTRTRTWAESTDGTTYRSNREVPTRNNGKNQEPAPLRGPKETGVQSDATPRQTWMRQSLQRREDGETNVTVKAQTKARVKSGRLPDGSGNNVLFLLTT